jgi:hypothetical protein
MPPKPRQGKPKPPPSGPASRPPTWLLIVAGVGIASLIALVGYALLGSDSGSGSGAGNARADLEAAGCTLQDVSALAGEHTITTPEGISKKWNTVPPTSGPHYEVAAIWGSYDDPVNLAQLVHNLEHGGVFILYGGDVPDSTVAQLESFYADHTKGTLLAPLPSLGDTIALGAWTTPSSTSTENATAYLAKCKSFDDVAFSSFFAAYQFKGPERFPADSLLPGS